MVKPETKRFIKQAAPILAIEGILIATSPIGAVLAAPPMIGLLAMQKHMISLDEAEKRAIRKKPRRR